MTLTEDQKRAIRIAHRMGWKAAELARKTGVAKSTIGRILHPDQVASQRRGRVARKKKLLTIGKE